MGFGGAAGGMNNSIKQNRALQRKKNNGFSWPSSSTKHGKKPYIFKKPNAVRVQQLRDQLANSKAEEKRKMWLTLSIIAILLTYLISLII